MVAELHSALHRPFQESASTRPVGRACPAQRPRTNAAVPITRFGSSGQRPTLASSRPTRKTLTTLVAGRALHCGQLLDEIAHDTGMSNDSGVADGTIRSRVALDEFEVDHLCRSRDHDVGREAVFDLSDTRESHGRRNRLAAPIGIATGNRSIVPPFRLLSGGVQAHACLDSPEISSARCRGSGSESSSGAPHRERCTRTWDASQWRLVISESAWSCSAGWIARFPVTPAPTTGSGSHRGPQSESRIETTAGSWPDGGWRPDQSSTPVPTRYDAASASQFCFPIAIRKCRSLAGAKAHDVVVSVARSQERSSPDGTSPCTRKSSAARASAGDVLAPARTRPRGGSSTAQPPQCLRQTSRSVGIDVRSATAESAARAAPGSCRPWIFTFQVGERLGGAACPGGTRHQDGGCSRIEVATGQQWNRGSLTREAGR